VIMMYGVIDLKPALGIVTVR